MAKQVIWTQKVLESFIELGGLNETEEYIMRSRCKNITVLEQSEHLHCSPATVNRTIADLKARYDAVQKEYPNIFPVRKSSKQEKYMDEH